MFTAAIVGIGGGSAAHAGPPGEKIRASANPQLKAGLLSYGFLFGSILIVSIIKPLNQLLAGVRLDSFFPQVATSDGFITAAGSGFIFKPFTHPGVWILFSAVVAAILLPRITRSGTAHLKESLVLPGIPPCRPAWAPSS